MDCTAFHLSNLGKIKVTGIIITMIKSKDEIKINYWTKPIKNHHRILTTIMPFVY